ncbi:response regulator transcription factor [Paenibacillus daejeonensis]|uniref:response regulator transcription factor n=1 Tax=Paenibacillus daejeonensis TaxID=135193 RepID=UPI000363E6D6|nr:response regulator [Paenibacillus daejeonensis]
MKGKLLIVDDEPFIRKGLHKLVESNALGWTVAGEAGNGQEALAKFRELKPDLVLTDIRMPLMDGLELARIIAVESPSTSVIILTGYRDFDYAQAAISHGVKHFLLKPCREEEVCRILGEAFEQFRMQVLVREKEAEEQRVKEDVLLRSALSHLPYDRSEAAAAERQLRGYEFWLLQVDSYLPQGRDYRRSDRMLLQFSVSNILQEVMAISSPHIRWLTLAYDRFAFWLPPEIQAEPVFEEAATVVKQLLGITLSSHRFGSFESFGALEGWMESKLRQTGAEAGAPQHGIPMVNESKVKLIRGEMTAMMLLGNTDELQTYAEQLLATLASASASPEEAKIEAFCAALAMNDIMRKELELDPKMAGEIGRWAADLHACRSREEVTAWLGRQVGRFGQALSSWQMDRNSGVIARAVQYIQAHYAEEIGLSDVAAYAHLSANYFGNLFKKETGESFSSYLSRLRMDKARLLLKNTDMKVAEVAEAVGYPDSNYFATAFKSASGCSPSEYRKRERTSGDAVSQGR